MEMRLLDAIQGILNQVKEMKQEQDKERVAMENLLFGIVNLLTVVEVDARIKLANITKN